MRLGPLERLAAGKRQGCGREEAHGLVVARVGELGERAREEIVTCGPRGAGAVRRPGGGPAATVLGPVDQIVVDERCRVDELD